MKWLICGSRNYSDWAFMHATLHALVDELGDFPTLIIHGDAPGADTLGKLWAEWWKIPTDAHPADWEKYGKPAGPIRNREMLTLNPDAVIGFLNKPRKLSRGTNDMLTIAEARHIPTYIYPEEFR